MEVPFAERLTKATSMSSPRARTSLPNTAALIDDVSQTVTRAQAESKRLRALMWNACLLSARPSQPDDMPFLTYITRRYGLSTLDDRG